MHKITTYQFFTGKGGVGKTSIACATAVVLADASNKVLLVSTDPASNMEDVLESPVNESIQAVKGTTNLYAVNIDPENSAAAYRDRVNLSLEGAASKKEIQKIREDLSGACTTEIASFDEFSRFVSGEIDETQFDVILFDTAPTGQTLRLLELTAAWSSFTDENPDGASCLGSTSALKSGKERYHTAVDRLRDVALTQYNIVIRSDEASLKEASRTSQELKELGMQNQHLVIHGVFHTTDTNDAVAHQIEALGLKQLRAIPDNLKVLPLKAFPLLPCTISGVQKLRSLFRVDLQKTISEQLAYPNIEQSTHLGGIDELADELCHSRTNGLIMGKGGVGKTITDSALPPRQASKERQVLLTTTDPAAHIQDFINQIGKLPSTLTVERKDPKAETKCYTDKILEQKGKGQTEKRLSKPKAGH